MMMISLFKMGTRSYVYDKIVDTGMFWHHISFLYIAYIMRDWRAIEAVVW